MPQLSRGRYIHDFAMEKTLIYDTDNNRCFIMELDTNEISPPENICDMIRGMQNDGVYQMNLEEVRKETYAHKLENVTREQFGCPIASICRDKKSYWLDETIR